MFGMMALCGSTILPPPQFDYVPLLPFHVTRIDDDDERDAACRALGAKGRWPIIGCERGDIAILPKDDPHDCHLRHAQGHRNGWGADHEGGHFE